MKKIVSFILLLCLCIGMIGCNSTDNTPKEYTSYVAYDFPWIGETQENALWYSTAGDQGVYGTYEKTINEITYSSKSAHTVQMYNGYIKATAFYDAERQVDFLVEYDASSLDTARVIYFALPYSSIDRCEEVTKNSEIPVSKIAIDFAKQYITDIYSYKLEQCTVPVAPDLNCGYYAMKFVFRKEINGYSTTDYISITITNGGTIESFAIGQIGAFDECQANVDFAKVKESVDNAVKAECDKHGIEMTDVIPTASRLIKRYDGRIVLASAFDFVIDKPNADYTRNSFCVVTPLDFEPFDMGSWLNFDKSDVHLWLD